MKKHEAAFALLLPLLDLSAAAGGYSLAYFLRQRTDFIPFVQTPEQMPPFPVAFPAFTVFGIVLVLYIALSGLYRSEGDLRLRVLTRILSVTVLWWFSIVAYYALIAHELFFSRVVLVTGGVLTAVLLLVLRGLARGLQTALHRRGIGRRRVVLVGQNGLASHLVDSFRDDPGLRIVGVLAQGRNEAWEARHPEVEYLGGTDDLRSVISRTDEVIVCDQSLSRERLEEILHLTLEHYRRFRFVPDLFELHATNIFTETVTGIPVIELKPTRLDGWGKIAKRIFDLVMSTVLLVVLSPFFLLVTILVHLTSPGAPAVVGLIRVRKNTTFRLYKFRSMIPNAHAMKAQLLAQNERGDGPLFKMKNDPRITPLGRFLRKSRIDELPQLWNVLKGDMSLVGPRPHEPEEVSKYSKHQRKLLRITPGLTGLAQVHGASDLSFDEEVRLDTYYIENWSLLMDLTILVRTVLVVLLGRGAA